MSDDWSSYPADRSVPCSFWQPRAKLSQEQFCRVKLALKVIHYSKSQCLSLLQEGCQLSLFWPRTRLWHYPPHLYPCSCSDSPSSLQLQWESLMSAAAVTVPHPCSCGKSLISAAVVTVPHLCSYGESINSIVAMTVPHLCSCSDNPSFLQLQWQVLISVAEVIDLHLCSCSDTPSSL